MLSLTPTSRDDRTQPRQTTSPEFSRRPIIRDVHHTKSPARRATTSQVLTLQLKSAGSATARCRADIPSIKPILSQPLLHAAGRRAGEAPPPHTPANPDSTTRRASVAPRAALRCIRDRAADLSSDKRGPAESSFFKNMDIHSRVNQMIRLALFPLGFWDIWADYKNGQTGHGVVAGTTNGRTTNGSTANGDTTNGGNSQVTSTDKSQQLSSGGGTRKRITRPQSPSDNGEGDEDEEDRDRLPDRPQKKRLVDADSQPQNLACPFYKFAPAKHYQCGRLSLSKISYVKQHLLRRHAHIYCMRCHAEFERPEELESHHRSTRPCELAPEGARPPGVSLSQKELLSQRSLHGRTEDEKWRDIWRILFPGKDPPLSVYIDPELPEEVNWFRDNMATQVSRNLRGKIEQDRPDLVDHSEALTKSLLDFITEISLDWKRQWAEEMEERGVRQTPRPIPVRDLDPAV